MRSSTLFERMSLQLGQLTDIELLRLHSTVLDELRARGAVRTRNNPIADYAEALVCKALSLRRAEKESKGHDAAGPDGTRYEIKSRRENPDRKATLSSPIRDLEGEHFDQLIIVLFAEDYTVKKAVELPRSAVDQIGRFVKHVNGWVIPLRENVWCNPHARDITLLLQSCQE